MKAEDGSFRWAKAEGAVGDEIEEIDTSTPFWIASVTKLFIAAAILKLYERGQLSLDDALARYLKQNISEA